jgi:hypothetical protein
MRKIDRCLKQGCKIENVKLEKIKNKMADNLSEPFEEFFLLNELRRLEGAWSS